jgi:hypothetical protein
MTRLSGPGAAAELVLVPVHIDAGTAKGHTLGLQAKALLQSRFAFQLDFALGADDAVPRQAAGRVQRPDYLARSAGKPGRARHSAIRTDLPSRDTTHNRKNALMHGPRSPGKESGDGGATEGLQRLFLAIVDVKHG